MIAFFASYPWLFGLLLGVLLSFILWGVGAISYGIGVQNGFLYHHHPEVREVLEESGIDYEEEIARHAERRRLAGMIRGPAAYSNIPPRPDQRMASFEGLYHRPMTQGALYDTFNHKWITPPSGRK